MRPGLVLLPWVYVLRCRDGTLYTGAALDLKRRLDEHAAGRASKYTRSRLPVVLVFRRRLGTWSEALRLEHRIKQLSRAEKLRLIGAAARRRAGRLWPVGRRRGGGSR